MVGRRLGNQHGLDPLIWLGVASALLRIQVGDCPAPVDLGDPRSRADLVGGDLVHGRPLP